MPVELSVDLPHLRLRGLSWGNVSSEPVIALHGWLDNAASFYRLAPLLTGYRVIAPDLAGHGFSDHRPTGFPYYVWDNVVDILALADHLELKRFHLVGHSMGAGIASLIAAVMPERVRSLVLLDGLVPVTTAAEQSPSQMVLALKQRKRIAERRFRQYSSVDEAVNVRAKSQYPVSLEAASALVERALSHTDAGWQWHTDPYLFAPSVLRLTEGQVTEFLKVIQAPVLLCLAQKGITTAQTQQLANYVRTIKVECLSGGHHFHLETECVTEVVKSISRHLQSL